MRSYRTVVALACAATLAGCASTQRVIEESGGDVVGIRTDASNFRTAMRELWAEHVIYTRDYIVSATGDGKDGSAIAARLMKNQEDIGNAIAPYYGSDAAAKLTSLLKDHINIAVELVSAAKAKDNAKVNSADQRWKANAAAIATFLSGANPNWNRTDLVNMLNEHLRLTTDEATMRLQSRWSDDVSNFDRIFDQAMHMADALADGVIKQFPGKFV